MLRCIKITYGGSSYEFNVDINDLSDLYGGIDSLVNKIINKESNHDNIQNLLRNIGEDPNSKTDLPLNKLLEKPTLSDTEINTILTSYLIPIGLSGIANFCKYTGVSEKLSTLSSIITKNRLKITNCNVLTTTNEKVGTRLITDGNRFVLVINTKDMQSDAGVEKITSLYTTICALSMIKNTSSPVFKELYDWYNKNKDHLKIDDNLSIVSKLSYLYLDHKLESKDREEIDKIINKSLSTESIISQDLKTLSWNNDLKTLYNLISIENKNKVLKVEDPITTVELENGKVKLDKKNKIISKTEIPTNITIGALLDYAYNISSIRNLDKDYSEYEDTIRAIFEISPDENIPRLYPKFLWKFFTENQEITKFVYSKLDVNAKTNYISRALSDTALALTKGSITPVKYTDTTFKPNITDVLVSGKSNFSDTNYLTFRYFESSGKKILIANNKVSKKVVNNTTTYYKDNLKSLEKDLDNGKFNGTFNITFGENIPRDVIDNTLELLSKYKSFTVTVKIDNKNIDHIIHAANKFGHKIDIVINKNTDKNQVLEKFNNEFSTFTPILNEEFTPASHYRQTIIDNPNQELIVLPKDNLLNYATNEEVTVINTSDNSIHKITIMNKIFLGYKKHPIAQSNTRNIGDIVKDKKGNEYVLIGANSAMSLDGNIKLGKTTDLTSTGEALSTYEIPGNGTNIWLNGFIYNTKLSKSVKETISNFLGRTVNAGDENTSKYLLVYSSRAIDQKNDEEFKATIRPFKTVPTNLNTENFINMLNGKISKSIKVKYFDNADSLRALLVEEDADTWGKKNNARNEKTLSSQISKLSENVAFTLNGIIYLNKNKFNIGSYFHELGHIIMAMEKANNPEYYTKFLNDILNGREGEFNNWLENHKEYSNLTRSDQIEEFAVQTFEDYINNRAESAGSTIIDLLNNDKFNIFKVFGISTETSIQKIMCSKINTIIDKSFTDDTSDKLLKSTQLMAIKEILKENKLLNEECK